jgi:hypothetical protein
MEQIISFFQNDDKPSLEEQIEMWEKPSFSSLKNDEIHDILFKNAEFSNITCTVPAHVYEDLEFFESKNENGCSFLQAIGKTQTPYGDCVLRHLLRHPLVLEKKIKERQWVIQKFYETPKLTEELENIWKNINQPEDLFWLWKKDDENSKELFDVVYYDLPFVKDYINSSEWVLSATSIYRIFVSPALSVATPLLCFLMPYFMLRYMGIPITFSQVFHLLKGQVFSIGFLSNKTMAMATLSLFLWMGFYLYNIYTLFRYASLTNRVVDIIHRKMKNISSVVKASQSVAEIGESFPDSIQEFFSMGQCDPQTEIMFTKDQLSCDPSLFSNKGCILASYWKSKSHLDDLSRRARILGYFDAFYTMSRYLRSIEHASLRWTYVTYNNQKKVMKKIWHPVLWKKQEPEKRPVTNSLKVSSQTNTLIVTGPNAAGKSTFVRTVLLNTIIWKKYV